MWCSQISVVSVGQKGFKLPSSVHPGATTPNITKLLLADPFGGNLLPFIDDGRKIEYEL